MSLKARLLFVSWIKVDSKLVYKAEPKPTETDEREPEVPVTSDATAAQQASAPEPSSPSPMLPTTQPMPRIGSCRSRSDPQGPIPGLVFSSSAGDLHDHHSRPTGHQDHPRQERRLQRRPPATSIGEFVVKNAELDQYREGKYDGDFVIVEIRPPRTTPTAAWSSRSAPIWAG